jgi:hypothetical protein
MLSIPRYVRLTMCASIYGLVPPVWSRDSSECRLLRRYNSLLEMETRLDMVDRVPSSTQGLQGNRLDGEQN